MKKISITMTVFGGGLAAFGFSGFDVSFRTLPALTSTIMGNMDGAAGWDIVSRIEISMGIALFIMGMFLYTESR